MVPFRLVEVYGQISVWILYKSNACEWKFVESSEFVC